MGGEREKKSDMGEKRQGERRGRRTIWGREDRVDSRGQKTIYVEEKRQGERRSRRKIWEGSGRGEARRTENKKGRRRDRGKRVG